MGNGLGDPRAESGDQEVPSRRFLTKAYNLRSLTLNTIYRVDLIEKMARDGQPDSPVFDSIWVFRDFLSGNPRERSGTHSPKHISFNCVPIT